MFPLPGEAFAARAYALKIPYNAVYFHCLREWGWVDKRADDMANEASAEAYARSLPRCFLSEEHYRRWVTRVALNHAKDVRRRERTRTTAFSTLIELLKIISNRSPSEGAEKNEAYTHANQALALLEPFERKVFLLSAVEDMKVSDIARAVFPLGEGLLNKRRLEVSRAIEKATKKLSEYLRRRGYD